MILFGRGVTFQKTFILANASSFLSRVQISCQQRSYGTARERKMTTLLCNWSFIAYAFVFFLFFSNQSAGMFSQIATQWKSVQTLLLQLKKHSVHVLWWMSLPAWKINQCRCYTEDLFLFYLVHLSPLAAVQFFQNGNTVAAWSCFTIECKHFFSLTEIMSNFLWLRIPNSAVMACDLKNVKCKPGFYFYLHL